MADPAAGGGEPAWVSSSEAAERIGVTARTLYRFINEGPLTAYRFGRVIRVRPADIATFVENNRIQPGSLGHLLPDKTDADEDDEQ